jgi:hypothetical protein
MDKLISQQAAIDTLKELTANGTNKGMVFGEDAVHRIEMLPSVQPNTTTHDSIPAETGKNDEDRTSGDCISRQAAIDALCSVCNALGGGHNCDKTKFVYNAPFDEQVIICPEHYCLCTLPSVQPEQQNARIFQGVIVRYPTYSTYPEYEGKPYFSIKYTEDGQDFIGYGTYKPDILSEYLKKYFMPSVQPDIIHCKDCKHSRFFDPCFYCYEMGGEIIVPENGFCFKAERRQDATD